jgi:branched-chain amino acid transport system ATP-binding protein
MTFLEVNGYSKSFGGLQAVNDVSFSVQKGQIKAVIGPNGAGKTTLFNLISGFLPIDSGTAFFDGREIHGLLPHQIAQNGVSRTFQHIRLFHGMSAVENVMVGRHTRSNSGFLAGMMSLPKSRREEREIRDKAMEALDFVGIADLADAEATSLSFGQQRAVEFARALAAEPMLLLLDEPAAGLNMHDTRMLANLILKIRESGVTVLLVEHDMSLVMNICDEILVLSYGSKIAEDNPLGIQKNDEVVRIYLGEEDDA